MIKRIKNKINVLRADPHMQEVVRGTLLAFILKIVGSGLAFAFNVAVARLLGAEGSGVYFLAISITAIGSVVGRVGLDNALLRYIATHATLGEWAKVYGIHAVGMRLAICISTPLSLLGFFTADWIAIVIFNKPELGEPLRWMSLSILPFSVLNLQAESLKGLKRIRDAMLIQGIGVPLVCLIMIWPLANLAGVVGLSWAYLAATLLVAMAGTWLWHGAARGIESEKSSPLLKEVWASCKPLYVIALMNAVLSWAPLLLLGIWATSAEVGIYGAATRLAILVSFLLVTLNNVIAPKFAELYARGDIAAMGQTARRSAAILIVLVGPLFIGLFFFSTEVMQLFGKEFGAGSVMLSVLLLGQLVNVITGSVGFLLMMSGNECSSRDITIGAALLQLVLVLLLAPKMGGLGAAIASATAMAVMNLVTVYVVYKKLGIITIPGLNKLL